MYWPLRSAHIDWFGEQIGKPCYDLQYVFRRGFVEELHLPVQWVIAHGPAIRARFPLLRKLAIFRLNGWGERLARCEHLRGLRELDLAGWYSDADAEALAGSPHLADLETLTYWRGNHENGNEGDQLRALAASKAWPKLRTLRVMLGRAEHAATANAAAGRAVAEVVDPYDWLFPFCAGFGDFFVGKLRDGRQMFGGDAGDDGTAQAVFFTATGEVIEERTIRFPPGTLPLPPARLPKDWNARAALERAQWEKRVGHLRDKLGFEPALIRVRSFRIGDIGPYRFRGGVEGSIGYTDEPDSTPEDDPEGALGAGRPVHSWVTEGAFLFMCGNDWWCDGTGNITST